MNKKYGIAYVCLALLSLGCNTETVVDTDLDLQGGKALYGVWEHSTANDLAFTDAVDSWNFYFTDSCAYFIYEGRGMSGWDSLVAGSTGFHFVVRSNYTVTGNAIQFDKDPSIVLELSKKWPSIDLNRKIDEYITSENIEAKSYNGIFSYAFTISSFDSLSWVDRYIHNYRNSAVDSDDVDVYTLQAPYEFIVLSIKDLGDLILLQITDKACYDLHKDHVETLDSYCDVTEFTKRGRPYFADVVHNVDTLSTTEAFFPYGATGRVTGKEPPVVVPIRRGEETW